MNAELLYTSAPQGLKQGSRGFCTVLSTVGMPLNIATKLESLSGYRHLHPSGTPDAAKNPVNHSHLKLTVGGRTLSVISRISDYGLDYSQRTNKLAHHVVVDSPMPACGPAVLLGDPSVIRSEWDGNCVNIPAPPTFPALSVEPAVCRAWESIAGDAGWAGVVANAWLNNASKPIFLIFSEDQSPKILPLIAEAIAILPPSKRWQATFGTYVTNLPPDVDCKVRCVVAGSDEARMASARGVVIDLTQPCGPAPSSEAATAARNGTFVGARSNVPPPHGRLEVGEEQPPAIGDTIEDSEPTDFDPERPFGTQSAGPPPTIRQDVRSTPKLQHQKNKRAIPNKTPLIVLALLASAFLIPCAYYFNHNINQFANISKENVIASDRKKTPNESSSEEAIKEVIEEPKDGPSAVPTLPQETENNATDDKMPPEQSSEKTRVTPMPITEPPRQLAQENLRITLGPLNIKTRKTNSEEIAIPLGITGATASAVLTYETSDLMEKELFEKWRNDQDSFRWTWSQSIDGGMSWSPRSEIDSGELTITSNDKPNTTFQVKAQINNNGLFKTIEKTFPVAASTTVKTEDYVLIEIDGMELATRSKNISVAPDFGKLKTIQGMPSDCDIRPIHSTRSTSLDDFSLEELKSRMALAGCTNGYMDPWSESLAALKEVNSLRDELKGRFVESKNDFEALVTVPNIPPDLIQKRKLNGVFAEGLQSLKELGSTSVEPLGYFNSWDTRSLIRWDLIYLKFNEQYLKTLGSSKLPEDKIAFVEIGLFKKNWILSDTKTASKKGRQHPHEVLDHLINANSRFQNLRREILNRNFYLDKPLSGAGLFVANKSESTTSDRLSSTEKALCGLEFWYRIKIKGPAGELINPVAVPPISQMPNLSTVQEQLQQPPN